DQARLAHAQVQTGEFAADMQVHLVNDGPVTIPMRMEPQV
ncbi:D-aminoacyl-tRNA deacylase, partial [Comamonas sp. C24C]